VIVGSAFVQRLLAAPSPAAGVSSVAELAAELAAGVRAAAGPAERHEVPAQGA
jgi:tryptophan synthase alpha subunit